MMPESRGRKLGRRKCRSPPLGAEEAKARDDEKNARPGGDAN